MTIDHKDENPANNLLENLRGMRHELNVARQCDPDAVQRASYADGKPKNCYRFRKPLSEYVKRSPELWQKAKDCSELKDAGFFENNGLLDTKIKIRNRKTKVTITDEEARQLAIARKRAQGRAVFAFLKREDPELFKGYEPEQDAAGEWYWVEADFFDEFVAKWR